MNKTIKVGAVSYLNTKPLLYGWKHGYIVENAELVEGYPAKVADMLLNDEIDVGLVPVSIIPDLAEYFIVSEYCIGATGPVVSVCIFSEVPLEQVETILLDYQSRTSVALAKILLKHYWKLSPEFVDADKNFIDEIKGTTAAVVIGDRAFELSERSAYKYDLAEAWVKFTGLPFVFAAWVANKELPEKFIAQFNEANRIGLLNLDKVVAENHFPAYDLQTYFTENVSYELTTEKRKGLDRFLQFLKEENLVTV